MSEKNEKKSEKKNSGLYVAVFILAVLVILILFMVKKNQIAENLQKTNFFERVGVTTPEFVKNAPKAPEKPADVEIDLMQDSSSESSEELSPDSQLLEQSSAESETQESSSASESVSEEQAEKSAPSVSESPVVSTAAKTTAVTPTAVPSTRKATLYFVSVGSDGSINRKSVVRELPKSDSPLTDAIKALLAGPIPSEGSVRNLVPNGTKLIGASVKDGVATLNFNDAFEFNAVGVEGSIAQLMQIVYTATEFSTVKSVQFLIEGEKREYLTEGIWIGSPLSRSSF